MTVKKRPERHLKPALVFLNGDLIAVPIPLERPSVVLGRAFEADVRINDTKVSRKHAIVEQKIDNTTGIAEYFLTDLSSRNGTQLNGSQIQTSEKLQSGDKISVGEFILRFDLMDEIDHEFQLHIHRLISHDDLTGLLSSRSFFSELRREVARATAQNRSFCVLMMDVDHFKSVNDKYGHLTGSRTLEELGVCITNNLRSGDAAARFGGEEFAAFLLEAEKGQGLVAAERIRENIEKEKFSIIRSGTLKLSHNITISIGLSTFPNDSTDPIELVEMADSALYRAKRDGRNLVRSYRPLTDEEKTSKLPPRRD